MKRIFIILVATLCCMVAGLAQEHKAGDNALLFTLKTNPVAIDNVNGGFGLQHYLAPALAVRGTLGFTLSNGGNPDTKTFATSAAALLTLASTENTAAYFGPGIEYNHSQPNTNLYKVKGIVGGMFSPIKNFSVGAEYNLSITSDGTVNTYNFGSTTGEILMYWWI